MGRTANAVEALAVAIMTLLVGLGLLVAADIIHTVTLELTPLNIALHDASA
jgi:hypothetical protein